ncbi:hypothetical protein CEXT_709261, partial [Caerostris extrusa]
VSGQELVHRCLNEYPSFFNNRKTAVNASTEGHEENDEERRPRNEELNGEG